MEKFKETLTKYWKLALIALVVFLGGMILSHGPTNKGTAKRDATSRTAIISKAPVQATSAKKKNSIPSRKVASASTKHITPKKKNTNQYPPGMMPDEGGHNF